MTTKKPPMGWNSWDCFGPAVTEETVRENALYMADKLKKFGWEYVVVDIQWSEPTANSYGYHNFAPLCLDEYGRQLPAENRFPSSKGGAGFKPLADFCHSLGLKFGIHILRGIPRQAVHLNLPVKASDYTARQAAEFNSVCMWNSDMYGADVNSPAAAAYYDSIFELYASWGVDFVKVDDITRPYHRRETELIAAAIKNSGRDMILSLSPGAAPLEDAEHLKQYANMWRMTDDFWDRWELLYAMFERAEKWSIHVAPGSWPDCDMLPIGAVRQIEKSGRWTNFTADEQYTMMTLWCIFRSPLMMGGDMTLNDAFTLSLMTNSDVLAMETEAHCAHQLYRRVINGAEQVVWIAPKRDGSGMYIAAFNLSDSDADIEVSLENCGLDGEHDARELWSGDKIQGASTLSRRIPKHGAALWLAE